jgi:hypothetical protein
MRLPKQPPIVAVAKPGFRLHARLLSSACVVAPNPDIPFGAFRPNRGLGVTRRFGRNPASWRNPSIEAQANAATRKEVAHV